MELLGLDRDALTDALGGPGRARLVAKGLGRGIDPRSDPEVGSRTRARLRGMTYAPPRLVTERVAADGTKKLLLGLDDGQAVECVLIPERSRTTLCVSSQVGCRRGCRFCMTATMSLLRSLTAAEILGQVHVALQHLEDRPPLRNVVFMGMGEPLDNPVAVEAALSVLTDDLFYAVGARHVTVSSVAPSPKAVLRARNWPGRLAWSLHAAQDDLRKHLVPTQRFETAALRDAFAEVCADRGEPLFVEIALLDGVNDRPEHADAVAALLAPFPTEVRINLLPMNPVEGSGLHASPARTAAAFAARLRDRGFFTTLRRPRGQDAAAACGQLATLPCV